MNIPKTYKPMNVDMQELEEVAYGYSPLDVHKVYMHFKGKITTEKMIKIFQIAFPDKHWTYNEIEKVRRWKYRKWFNEYKVQSI